MSNPKAPFEAAVRAARTTAYWMAGTDDERFRAIIRSALAAALPPDPAPETLAAIDAVVAGGLFCEACNGKYPNPDCGNFINAVDAGQKPPCFPRSFAKEVMLAVRASLLPGEKPT